MQAWWRAVARYPATWIAILVVVLIEWAFFALLDPPPLLAIIAIVLGIIAVLTWPVVMSATGTLSRLQFEVPRIEEVSTDERKALEAELSALTDPRPLKQLEAVTQKRDNLAAILLRRMDAGEMTYARYLATTEQVYRATLDNLHEVAIAVKSISAIDDEYIDGRLGELGSADSEAAARERESLTGRRNLGVRQRARIAELLAQNEAGMTAIDETAGALADAPIGRTPEDAEAAMEALTELAERAGRYVAE